jgi:hypothetical protein
MRKTVSNKFIGYQRTKCKIQMQGMWPCINGFPPPLNRLADLMSQGQMDLDVLKEDRNDELGVLTKSFNRLIISLKMALSR